MSTIKTFEDIQFDYLENTYSADIEAEIDLDDRSHGYLEVVDLYVAVESGDWVKINLKAKGKEGLRNLLKKAKEQITDDMILSEISDEYDHLREMEEDRQIDQWKDER